MAADQEYIPADLPEDLPEPQAEEIFENGTWLQSFGERQEGPLVMVHGSDAKLQAVVFPNGVIDEDGNEIDTPASVSPTVFIAHEGIQDKTGMAAYAAKVALEKSND